MSFLAGHRQTLRQTPRPTWKPRRGGGAASDADPEENEPLLSAVVLARWPSRAGRGRDPPPDRVRKGVHPPRPADLAAASGMSVSGIRTAYDHQDVADVEQDAGRKPRE
ncbi:hypothetical protein GCM10010289_79320 [Streptomyces violascens]|nr:hypothetical protein GCM10010289_79320 [Streptomyces violascens]